MAQRISEQVVEWLTVGGDSFTPNNLDTTNAIYIPLVINQHGNNIATLPATATGNIINIYNNKGQLWTLGVAAASTNVKSSQLIISSKDEMTAGGTPPAVGFELWRGSGCSWQFINDSAVLYVKNNYTSSTQDTYVNTNLTIRHGEVDSQYFRIHSTKDSNYTHSTTGAALIVDGGATFAKKVYIADDTDSEGQEHGALVVNGSGTFAKRVYIFDTHDVVQDSGLANALTTANMPSIRTAGGAIIDKTLYVYGNTDSNYATKAGAIVTNGGAYIGKKTYIADTTDSNYATVAGSFVACGGAHIKGKVYVASTQDSSYATLAGSLVTAGGLYVTKKTYIADTTDSNYSTLAGALVVAGGANFGKKVYLKDTTDSTSYTTGSFVTAGGAAITKQLRVQGVTTHGGNVVSDTNATDSIGVTATRWKEGYFSTLLNIGPASTTYTTTDNNNVYIGPGVVYSNTKTANSTYGYYLYGHGTSYGHWYVHTFGTANTPAAEEGGTGTAGTVGWTGLSIGNSTAVNTNTEYGSSVSGANNAAGTIYIYGPGTKYGAIRASGTATGNHIYYLPRLNTSTSTYYGKLVGIYKSTTAGDSGFSDVGSLTKGVYVTADGKVTAMSYSLSATVNSGTTNYIAYYSNATTISADPHIYRSANYLWVEYSTATAVGLIAKNSKYEINFHVAASGNRGIYEGSTAAAWLLYWPNGSYTATLPKGGLTANTGNIIASAGSIWAGTNGNTDAERQVGVQSGAGQIYMCSTASTTGNRGIWLPAHGTGSAHYAFCVGTNNECSFADYYNGTMTKLAYSQSALANTSITYVTCWNGYELRAINKDQFVLRYSISNTSASASGGNDEQAARHIAAIQGVFSSHQTSSPESFYMSTGNGSVAFGYLLSGTNYNTTGKAYGGYFIARYNEARYLGISNGTWAEHQLVKGACTRYYGTLSQRPSTAHTGDVYFATI